MPVAVVLALVGCSPGPAVPTVTIRHTETVVLTNHQTVTTTTTVTETVPPGPTPCDLRTPGTICTYVGVPHVAQFSPEALDRRESALYLPVDVTWNPADGQLYILDFNNHRIRTVMPDDTVVTVAGTGFLGDGVFDDVAGTWGGGAATSYSFNHPTNVAFDPLDPGAMYIAAWHNSRVVVLRDAWVSYFAGTGGRSYGPADPDGDGVFLASDAVLNMVSSVAFDPEGTLYITDMGNLVIRAVARDGTISEFAGKVGNGGFSGDGADASAATLSYLLGDLSPPQGGLAWHDGALFVADSANQVIRKIDLATHVITTVAGTYVPEPGGLDTDGDGDPDLFYGLGGYSGDKGLATEARLNFPVDVAFGPDGTMYIADTWNNCVRQVDPAGIIETFAGKCGSAATWAGPDLGDGLDPLDATLNNPSGVEVDGAGNVYIADQYDQVIRVVWGPGGP